MKSSYSGLPEGLTIMLEPSDPNFASYPIFGEQLDLKYAYTTTQLRNLDHSHDASQTFGHPKSHTLGQPAKGQSYGTGTRARNFESR